MIIQMFFPLFVSYQLNCLKTSNYHRVGGHTFKCDFVWQLFEIPMAVKVVLHLENSRSGPRTNTMVTFEASSSIDMFFFHGNQTTFAEIYSKLDQLTARQHLKSPQSLSVRSSHLTFQSHGNIWGLELNPSVCFSFCGNQTFFSWDTANSIIDLENSRSMSWPRPNPMVPFEA